MSTRSTYELSIQESTEGATANTELSDRERDQFVASWLTSHGLSPEAKSKLSPHDPKENITLQEAERVSAFLNHLLLAKDFNRAEWAISPDYILQRSQQLLASTGRSLNWGPSDSLDTISTTLQLDGPGQDPSEVPLHELILAQLPELSLESKLKLTEKFL